MLESLTNRLIVLMEQIASNQIADLIEENRLEKERLMGHEQIAKSFPQNAFESLIKIKQESNRYSKSMTYTKNNTKQTKTDSDELERQRKIEKLGSIWCSSTPTIGISNKLSNSALKSNASGKRAPAKNKFLKVARVLVIVNSMKKGHTVCTCHSLDSKCKRHDA